MRPSSRLGWAVAAIAVVLCAPRLVEVAEPAWPSNVEVFPAVDGLFPGRPPAVVAVPDDEGGAITVFADGGQVRAQRIAPDGELLWVAEGVAVPSHVEPSDALRAVADGSGGVIVAWLECEAEATTGCDATLQRLDGDGALLWDEAGVLVSDHANLALELASDGSGGAFVAWSDDAACVQHVDASGTPEWEGASQPCTAGGAAAALLSDGAGGAFLAWQLSVGDQAWAQRIGPAGTFLWAEPLDLGTGDSVRLVFDPSGGVFASTDLTLRRADADGALQWSQLLGGGVGPVRGLAAIADGAGGVLAVWNGGEGSSCSPACELRAQRVDLDGEPLWDPEGARLAGDSAAERFPSLVSDGAEGAIVVWQNCEGIACDSAAVLMAQRIDAAGERRWFGQGVELSAESVAGIAVPAPPRSIPDGAGGALAFWRDDCAFSEVDGERCSLFAQRVVVTGEELLAACADGFDDDGDGLVDHPADPGCDAPDDDSETSPALVCDDGLDNDGDSQVDFPADPGCADPMDPSESQPGVVCDDGLDNDGDGAVDLADAGCASLDDSSERFDTACDNGLDDDGDGRVDFPDDPGCTALEDASEDSLCAPEDFLCDGHFALVGSQELRAKGVGKTSESASVDLVFGDGTWAATVTPSGVELSGEYDVVNAKKGKAELRVSSATAQDAIDALLDALDAPVGSLLPPEGASFRLRAKPKRPVRVDGKWKLAPAGDGRGGRYRLKAEGTEAF